MSEIKINLKKIVGNYLSLKEYAKKKDIIITPVVKVVAGDINIVQRLEANGAEIIGDSRIYNIRKFKKAGINSKFLLLRLPAKGEISEVVKYSDYSLNSSADIISMIDKEAKMQKKHHGIVLMIEMGDLREGVCFKKALEISKRIYKMDNVYLKGIGSNFACYGGVVPSDNKMRTLSEIAENFPDIEWISGGNSANICWMRNSDNMYKINHLRLGESIMLGLETLSRKHIPGLHLDSFILSAEVIEFEKKSSIPDGKISQDAFGKIPEFTDEGIISRAILDVGRQDVDPDGLTPIKKNIKILGASSDHLIVKCDSKILVGDKLEFIPNYSALLRIMTSVYIKKSYTE
ncbi:MAG: alanine/ornithine racemase family PLP-dependent enzyme [Candidatus Aminicenantes bacterium]|nr:alanine/ornithine racemase family PLP-dependent enzyme [Candidatus Aminicenantes bacterium]